MTKWIIVITMLMPGGPKVEFKRPDMRFPSLEACMKMVSPAMHQFMMTHPVAGGRVIATCVEEGESI